MIPWTRQGVCVLSSRGAQCTPGPAHSVRPSLLRAARACGDRTPEAPSGPPMGLRGRGPLGGGVVSGTRGGVGWYLEQPRKGVQDEAGEACRAEERKGGRGGEGEGEGRDRWMDGWMDGWMDR
eukprot:763488-Hanusia_phi.AAC.2